MISIAIISILYFISILVVYLVFFMGKYQSSIMIDQVTKLDIDPTLAGYLYDNSDKNFKLLFVNILQLVKKDYIKMKKINDGYEVDYVFNINPKREDINLLKNYEIMAYNFLFNDQQEEVKLSQILTVLNCKEDILKQAKVSALYAHKEAVKNELETQNLITNKNEKLKSIHQIYFIVGCIATVLSAIFINLLLIITFVVWTIMTGAIFSYIANDIKYTNYGVNEREKIIKYKNYLKEILKETKFDWLEDKYLYAIAFGINFNEKETEMSLDLRYEIKTQNQFTRYLYSNDLATVYFVRIAIIFSITLLVIIMLNMIGMVMNLNVI